MVPASSAIIQEIETMQMCGLASLAFFYHDSKEYQKNDLCRKNCAAITMGCLSQWPFELCCNVIAIHKRRAGLAL